jgi:hypothetical protein
MKTHRTWFKAVASTLIVVFTTTAAAAPTPPPKRPPRPKTRLSAQAREILKKSATRSPRGMAALRRVVVPGGRGPMLARFNSRFKEDPKELGKLLPMPQVIAQIRKEMRSKKNLPGDPILLDYERWLEERKKPDSDAKPTAPGELSESQQQAFNESYPSVLIPDIKTYALFMHDVVFVRHKVSKPADRSDLMFQYACRALSRALPGFAKIVEVKITPGTDITGSWDAPLGMKAPEQKKGASSKEGAGGGAAEEKPKEEVIEVCSVTHRQVEETLKKDLTLIARAIDPKAGPLRDLVTLAPEPKLTGKPAPRNLNAQKLDSYDPRLKDLTFRDITKRLLSFHRSKGGARNFARALTQTKGTSEKLGAKLDKQTPGEALQESKHHSAPKVLDARNKREMLRRIVEQWTYGYEYESVTELVIAKIPKLKLDYVGVEGKLTDEFWSDCKKVADICQEPREPKEVKACARCALFAFEQHCLDGKEKNGKLCREIKEDSGQSLEKRKEELLSEETKDKCGEPVLRIDGAAIGASPNPLAKGQSGHYKVANKRFAWFCNRSKPDWTTCAEGTEWIYAERAASGRNINWKCYKGDPPGEIVKTGLNLQRWPGTFREWLGFQLATQASQVAKYASTKESPEQFLMRTMAWIIGKKFLAEKDDEAAGFTRAGLRYLDSLPVTTWQRCILWWPAKDPAKHCMSGEMGKLKIAEIAKMPWHLSIMARESAKNPKFKQELDRAHGAARGLPGGPSFVPTGADPKGLEPDQQERMQSSADTAGDMASPIVGKLLGMLLKAAGLYETMKAMAQAAGLTPAQSADCEDREYRHEVMGLKGSEDNKRGCLLKVFAKNFGSVLESIIIMLGNKLVDWAVDLLRGALQSAKTSLLASAGSVPFAGSFLAGLVDVLWELLMNFGLKMVLKGFVVAQLPTWLKVKEMSTMAIDKLIEHPIVNAVMGIILFLIDSAMVHGDQGWMEAGIDTALAGISALLENKNEVFWLRALTFAKKKLHEKTGIASGAGMLQQLADLAKAMLEGFFVALGRGLRGDAAAMLEQAKTEIMALDFSKIGQQIVTNPLGTLREKLVPQVGRLLVPIVSTSVTLPEWAETLLSKAAKILIALIDPKGKKPENPWKEIIEALDPLGKALLERIPVGDASLRALLDQGYSALLGAVTRGDASAFDKPAPILEGFLDAMNPVVSSLARALTGDVAADAQRVGETITTFANAVGGGNVAAQKEAAARLQKVVTALTPMLEAASAKALAYPPLQKLMKGALAYIGQLAAAPEKLSQDLGSGKAFTSKLLGELDAIFGPFAEEAVTSLISAGLPRELARLAIKAARGILRDPSKLIQAIQEAKDIGAFARKLLLGSEGLLGVLLTPVKSDALRVVLEECLKLAFQALK